MTGILNRKKIADTIAAAALPGPSHGPAKQYRTATGLWPANNQVWTVGKKDDGSFDPALLATEYFGNTPAPKGHFIIQAFQKNYSEVSQIEEIKDLDYELSTRPTCTVTFSNRVLFSGVQEQESQGKIWVSRVVKTSDDIAKCYQEQDPTAEIFNELVATDGFVINLAGAGTVLKLLEYFNGVLVFASNGVWYLNGADGIFSAINFQADKLSDAGCISRRSVVAADNVVYFWSADGIYAAVPTSSGVAVKNISDPIIKAFYNGIPTHARSKARAVYLRRESMVEWWYPADEYAGESSGKLNKVLQYDTRLNAFFPHSISDIDTPAYNSPFVVDGIEQTYFGKVVVNELVTTTATLGGTVLAVTLGAENVTVPSAKPAVDSGAAKYLTIVHNGGASWSYTFSEFNNSKYLDWEARDGYGTSFSSYAETFATNIGDLLRSKQAHYVTTFMEKTPDELVEIAEDEYQATVTSGCLVSARWSWTTGDEYGKWTPVQQAYKYPRYYSVDDAGMMSTGLGVIKSKLLLRGSGVAFSLRFQSEPMKAMNLLGWAVPVTAEAAP